jgi:CRISPR/Cas system CSM-associated protein Csm2 small subunit
MSSYEEHLNELYELGYKHGYTIGRKDEKIEQLRKELGEL